MAVIITVISTSCTKIIAYGKKRVYFITMFSNHKSVLLIKVRKKIQ